MEVNFKFWTVKLLKSYQAELKEGLSIHQLTSYLRLNKAKIEESLGHKLLVPFLTGSVSRDEEVTKVYGNDRPVRFEAQPIIATCNHPDLR